MAGEPELLVSAAKTDATRDRRNAQMLEWLIEGKQRNLEVREALRARGKMRRPGGGKSCRTAETPPPAR